MSKKIDATKEARAARLGQKNQEVFCSRTSWLLWRNLSSTAWRKNRLYIQSRLWSAFLRRIFMVCILAAEISDEYCKS